MTLIESALQKLQKSGQLPSAGKANARTAILERARPAATPPVPLLHATIDKVQMERHCVLPRISDESALRAYKILRTRLLQKLGAENWRSLVVTGADVQQGKTLTSVNLAFALAQDPSTSVCIVDLDLRRPQVANCMGMQFNFGLGDYLSGNAEIEQIVYEVGVPRLAVIPNAHALQQSSELLSSPRMKQLVDRLQGSAEFNVIIYDMPPLMMSDDVLVFGPQVDGLLFVVAEGLTQRDSVEKAKEVLADMNVMGVILNRSREANESGYY